MKIPIASLTLSLFVFSSAHLAQSAEGDKSTAAGQSITEFDKGDAKDGGLNWQVVNDGVMGGLSKGNLKLTKDGTLLFSGELSLKNNGGFSTIRTDDVSYNLTKAEGLHLRVKGDGRTYQARLATDARFRGMEVSFGADFATKKGEWTEVKVPFSSFKGSFRGMNLKNEKLDPAKIQRLGILLGDKKEGPFEVEVDFIRSYGGQSGQAKGGESGQPTNKGPQSLTETAVKDGRFKTLVAALGAAGLTEALSSDKQLTVFAPTDAAFAKLPKETVADLLKPENKKKLVSILAYHVVPGSVGLGDALKLGKGKTLQGGELTFGFSKGDVKINDASLIDSDIRCSNGVIHVIDSVLQPAEPETPTVLTKAKEVGQFGTLLAAIDSADLSAALGEDGPFTVFAPTDRAFAALPKGTVETLLKKENKDQLVSILTYHVVSGKVDAGSALKAGKAKTLQGESLKFAVKDGLLKVNDATIRTVDVDGGNGVIHVIDAVLIPSKKAAKTAAKKGSDQDPMAVIKPAIEKGVVAYNSGNAGECAKIYRECVATLSKNSQLDSELREKLAGAVERGTKYTKDRERAWYYRKIIDMVVNQIRHSR